MKSISQRREGAKKMLLGVIASLREIKLSGLVALREIKKK